MRLRFRRDDALACQQVVELLTDHLEGALPPRLAKLLDQHLAKCPSCTAFLEQLRASIALASSIPPAEVPDDVVDALADAFAEYHRTATDRPEGPSV